jgi:hypothetical protein
MYVGGGALHAGEFVVVFEGSEVACRGADGLEGVECVRRRLGRRWEASGGGWATACAAALQSVVFRRD